MSKEAAVVVGILVTIVNAVVLLAGLGGFDDGFQWEDLAAILTPLLGSAIVRQYVWSQDTVDQLASRDAQNKTVVTRREMR